jgi:acyl-CoA synthetase (NDP forming)
VDGALKQAGMVRVLKYSQLFQVAKALSSMPLPKGNRVSFLAPSGAMLVVLTDLCRQHLGLDVPDLEEPTRKRLQEISPSYIRMRNPVDIWPAAVVNGIEYAYREGMKAVLKDPNIDAVVPILMLTEDTGVPPLDFIVDLARKYPEKPIYVTFSGDRKYMDQAKAFLESKGVPTYPMIDETTEGLMPILVTEICGILKKLHQYSVTVLFVEQNCQEALSLSSNQRAYVLEKGQVRMAAQKKNSTPDRRKLNDSWV